MSTLEPISEAPPPSSLAPTGVLALVPETFVRIIERRGPRPELLEGLSFGREQLADARTRLPWDDCAVLFDRIHAALGDEGLISAARDTISTYEAYAPLAALFVEPSWLYKGSRLIGQKLYGGNVRSRTWDWLPDGRLHVVEEVATGRRPCLAYMVATVGALSGVPLHLGLGPADVESDLSPSRGEYWVTLPASSTLRARGAALVAHTRQRFIDRFLDQRAVELLVSAGVPPDPVRPDADLTEPDGRVLERAAAAWRLTPRQREVFTQLAEGRSNKEIGARLGLAERTVELHVTTVLRKAQARTRAELVTRAIRRFSRSR